MKKRRSIFLFFVIAGLIVGGCADGAFSKYEKYSDFFKSPPDIRQTAFKSLPVEEKYNVCIYAMILLHPPELGYAYDLATYGDKIVPFLIEKLRESEHIRNKGDRAIMQQAIIYIFENMALQQQNLLSDALVLNGNVELVKYLEEIVSRMDQNSLAKELSEQSLLAIRKELAKQRSKNRKGDSSI